MLNFFCSALFHMKTTVSFKYFVNDCSLSDFQITATVNKMKFEKLNPIVVH